MPDSRFFDTNILIYAFAAGDPRNARAEALVAGGGVIGVQVLNEFTNVTRRKLRWPIRSWSIPISRRRTEETLRYRAADRLKAICRCSTARPRK